MSTGPAIKGNLGDELIFDGFIDYADFWISGENRDYLLHVSTSMIETVISETERVYTFNSVYGPLDDRLRVTINTLGLYEAEFIDNQA